MGDDRPDPNPPGDVAAGSFTRCWHGRRGTSEQKVRWFSQGLKTGDLAQGDTITAGEL